MPIKQCIRCGEVAEHTPHATYCKACVKVINRENYQRRVKYSRYGLTEAEARQMLEDQKSACLVCSAELHFGSRDTHIDHCHDTGEVRGILCRHCNIGIGHFLNDPQRLRWAADYLEARLRSSSSCAGNEDTSTGT